MSFDKMVAEYKDMVQMKTFAEAQFKTITELSKKIQTLEEQNKHLQELLEKTNPMDISTTVENQIQLGVTDEEFICRTQLRMLKELSAKTELTKEEAQKVDLYARLLKDLGKAEEESTAKIEPLDTTALLAALESNNE